MVASTCVAVTVLPGLTARLSSLVVPLMRSKARSALCTASNCPTTLTVELRLPCRTGTTCVKPPLAGVAFVAMRF